MSNWVFWGDWYLMMGVIECWLGINWGDWLPPKMEPLSGIESCWKVFRSKLDCGD